MRAKKSAALMVVLVLTLGISLFSLCLGTMPAQAEVAGKQGCKECHAAAADEIKTAGGKHRAVPCGGCHLGHPPTARKALQSCNRCHLIKKKAHYELGNCLSCHKNPHTPLNISFADIKGNCVSCHATQVAMLREIKANTVPLSVPPATTSTARSPSVPGATNRTQQTLSQPNAGNATRPTCQCR